MNADDDFGARVARMPVYMRTLLDCPPIVVANTKAIPEIPAIYALYEQDRPCYVGRSGPRQRLRRRIANHQRPNFNAASFAYKRTRLELGLPRSYKRGSGHTKSERRDNLDFVALFNVHRQRIAGMTLKFVQIDDQIDQYLFELYATLELGLDLSGFETH